AEHNEGKSYDFRDYIQGIKNQGAVNRHLPYISRVYRSEADKKATVAVAFALHAKDGSFVGVLVAEILTGSAFGRIDVQAPRDSGIDLELIALSDHERDHEKEPYPDPVIILADGLGKGETKPLSRVAASGRDGSPMPDTPLEGTPFTVRVR